MAEQSANLRVRVSADLNDIKQGLAVLRGQLNELRNGAREPLPRNNAINELGNSANQTANAMRQLPAQFTDIFTSLQGGMPFFTVLVQQGGQIRDSFGGTSEALEGVTNGLLDLVTPGTVVAAVVGGLAIAWYNGMQQQEAFSQSLITSGNYARTTIGDMEALRSEIESLDGVTRGTANEAVQRAVGSGQIAGAVLDDVAKTAARMATVTSQSVETTIAKFSQIAEDPVEGLLKLNEAEHFLTQAQLERIRTLQEEGRVQDAATEAVRLYAAHLDDVANKSEAAMTPLAKLWRDVKKEASDTVGELQNYLNLLSKLAGFKLGNAQVQSIGDLFPMLASDQLRAINAYGKRYLKQQGVADFSNVQSAVMGAEPVDSKEEEARQKWLDKGKQYLTDSKKLEDEITESRKQATAAGITDVKVLQEREAAIKAAYERRKPKGADASSSIRSSGLQEIRDQFEIDQSQMQASTRLLQAQYQAREVTAAEYYARTRQLTEQAEAAEAASIQKQIDYLRAQGVAGKDAIEVGKQIGQMEAKLVQLRAEGTAQLQVLGIEERKVARQRQDALAAYQAALDASTSALQEDLDAMVARAGAGDREYEIQQRLNGVYREQAQRLTELALQKNDGRIDAETAAEEEASLRAATERRVQVIQDGYQRMAEAQSNWGNGAAAAWANYVNDARNAAGQVETAVGSALGGLEDVFVEFVKTGKLSFSDLADSIIADLARIAAKQVITGLLGAMFGQPGAGAVQREAIPIQGWDSGGYTGPGSKFEPAGVVHKGEGVLSQRDIASIGGPAAFLSMLSAIRSGRGYAAGGLVGSTVMPVAGRGGGQMAVEINNYSGQPSQQREERSRGADGSELRKMIIDIGAADIASGGRMAGAIESRFDTRTRR